jgi:glucose/arabinose dehydrogenase
MRIFTAAVLTVALVAGCTGAAAAPASGSSGLTTIGTGLQGPAGLTASVYATGLTNVAALAFDADDRLWAATASFADDGTDAIYLVATAGATPLKVIAAAHTPLGLVWDGATLYVSSGNGIVAYEGFDGAAFASHRTVLALPAGVGQLNGLAMSPDGRLYLGVSAPCDACTTETTYAAAVVSVLPDGTDLRVEAGHIRAPVGLAFFPGTDDLFVTMNQRDDLGEATPGDWLSIVRSGQDWGFPDCYGQGGSVCDGVPTPLAVLDAHAAVSGVAIVAGGLGSTVGTSELVAEWARGVVLRVPLTTDGTTSAGAAEPFLTGLTQPVGVASGPDGAVFVGDWGTGTVYRIRTSAAASRS